MVNCSLRIYLVRKNLVCTVIDTDYNGEDWLQNTILQFLISVLYIFELDRPKSDKTKNKEDSFKYDILDSPMDISLKNCKDVLKASVILDWQHLQNQLSKEHQQRKDNRDKHDTQQQKKTDEKSKNSMKQMFEKVKGDSTHDEGDLENNNDENYTLIEKRIKTKKIDVMGPISNTGDRLGLSSRSKAMIAAAV